MTNESTKFGTFLIAFLSGVLFFCGLGILLLSFGPVLYTWVKTSDTNFQPLLPLAEARAEEFLTVDDIPPVTLYPPQAALNPPVAELEPHTVGWIRIPALDVNVPVAMSSTMNDADVLTTLVHGAALYPNGVPPGGLGNTFISAHSTGEPWKGKYRFAFVRLNELEPGHEIHLDVRGARYTYRVVEKQLVKPTLDFRVESGRPKPTLTLMACWPLWTTNQRMLVTGELTNITKLTARPS